MKIKKTFQGVIPENKILNAESTSQTDTYSCDYINNTSIVVSPTEPTGKNRKKVWMQNTDTDKKIYIKNSNDVYEEFIKKDEGEVYSTVEQVIGKWIDGKPIYRRYIEVACNTSGDTVYTHNSNIDNLVNIYGRCYVANQTATKRVFPYVTGTENFKCSSYNSKIITFTSSWANSKFFGVIEYTKTTD